MVVKFLGTPLTPAYLWLYFYSGCTAPPPPQQVFFQDSPTFNQFPCTSWGKKNPEQHDTATTVFHCGGGRFARLFW